MDGGEGGDGAGELEGLEEEETKRERGGERVEWEGGGRSGGYE